MSLVRKQTQDNRVLGINAGRQRREAQAVITELANDVDRRRRVYRDDAVHTGEEGRSKETLAAQMRRTAEMTPEIIRLRKLGWTYLDIANETGVSQSTALNVCTRARKRGAL